MLVSGPVGARGQTLNQRPVIESLTVSPAPAPANASAVITCTARDESQVSAMTVAVTGGSLPGGTNVIVPITPGVRVVGSITWSTPGPGTYGVTCRAQDNGPFTKLVATSTIQVVTEAAAAEPPTVGDLAGLEAAVLAGRQVSLRVTAVDPAGLPLTYAWSAEGGSIVGSGAEATWTAPEIGGAYAVTVQVSNPGGGRATATATGRVLLASHDGVMGELRTPRRIAAGPGGELYVVDGRGLLWFLTQRGGVKGSVDVGEEALAVAVTPAGIAVSTVSGKLALVDPASAKVTGRVDLGPAPGPTGLAYEPGRGLLWLADRERNELRAVTLDGAVVVRLSSAGLEPLVAPLDVAVDRANGLVWCVTEHSEYGRLAHAFTTGGAYVKSAVTYDEVTRAGGAAVDDAGRLYVSDFYKGKIQVFGGTGQLAGTLGAYGVKQGELRQPAGMAVTPAGVMVASLGTSRIERFGQGGALPTCAGDSDCDGLPDAWELAHGLNPYFAGDAWADLDGDGLTSLEEYALGTHPRNADTDGDGFADGDELLAGNDPRDSGDHVPALLASDPAPSGPGLVRIASSLVAASASCAVQWTQVDGPAVELRGARSLSPSFVAREAGTYAFTGAARCGTGTGAPVRVEAVVENVAPRPDGGGLAVVPANQYFFLDGSFSDDANGGPLALRWDQSLGLPSAFPTAGPELPLRMMRPGYRVFTLTATDEQGLSASQDVPVYVAPFGLVPTAITATPLFAEVGGELVLDATHSVAPPGATYEWNQVAGASVELSGRDDAVARFMPLQAGAYAFEVSVLHDGVRSPPSRVDVFVAQQGAALPVAAVRALGEAPVGEPVELDGSASRAAGGGALRHRWRQIAGPAAGLTDADRAVATVVPFATGTYLFELVVEEEGAQSVPARVQLHAARPGERRPVAVAGAPGTAAARSFVVLDGRDSAGVDGWRWTQVSGPWVPLQGLDSPVARFYPVVAGVYSFELVVSDGPVRSAPAQVSVLVLEGGEVRP